MPPCPFFNGEGERIINQRNINIAALIRWRKIVDAARFVGGGRVHAFSVSREGIRTQLTKDRVRDDALIQRKADEIYRRYPLIEIDVV